MLYADNWNRELTVSLENQVKTQAEVESLRGQLQQAVEFAEVFESELDEYHSVIATVQMQHGITLTDGNDQKKQKTS